MGIAAADRVTGNIPAAMHALDQAEPIAVRLGLEVEQSKIHHTRGNLYFVLGDGKACNEQHEAALEIARRCGNAECEARALGGLGMAIHPRTDAQCARVLRCASKSAGEKAWSGWKFQTDAWKAIACGMRIRSIVRWWKPRRPASPRRQSGLLQGEIFAQESLALFLVEAGRYEEGEQACVRGLSLARPRVRGVTNRRFCIPWQPSVSRKAMTPRRAISCSRPWTSPASQGPDFSSPLSSADSALLRGSPQNANRR